MGKYIKKEEYIALYGEEAWKEYSAARCAKAKEWREANKEHIVEYNKMNHARYYENNKEKVAAAHKRRYERDREKILAKRREYSKQRTLKRQEERRKYEEEHKEEIAEAKRIKEEEKRVRYLKYQKEYYRRYNPTQEQKDYWKALKNDRRQNTKRGRAQSLVENYRRHDKLRGLDPSSNVETDWIVEHIFSGQKCVYCGDDDWQHLGCDRVDDDMPHVEGNIVPCCSACNSLKGILGMNYEEFLEYRKFRPRDNDSAIVGNVIEDGIIKKRAV